MGLINPSFICNFDKLPECSEGNMETLQMKRGFIDPKYPSNACNSELIVMTKNLYNHSHITQRQTSWLCFIKSIIECFMTINIMKLTTDKLINSPFLQEKT